MNKILFLDTNFLISNKGKMKNVLEIFNNSGFEVYITKLVKEEYINIQLRGVKENFNKLKELSNKVSYLEIKSASEEDVLNKYEKKYNTVLDYNFKDHIIDYDESTMLKRVLERNRYKKAPFILETGHTTSDKGFKDTIIFLTIKDFIREFQREVDFYIITSDKGFIDKKNELQDEIEKDLNRKISIVDGKDLNSVYKQLEIEIEGNTKSEENIFNKLEVDKIQIEDVSNRINEIMYMFNTEISPYGYNYSPYEENKYDLVGPIEYSDAEWVLENLKQVLYNMPFNKTIRYEELFRNNLIVTTRYEINVETLKALYDLYEKIKNTEYKKQFIQFVMNEINKNVVTANNDNNYSYDEDDLPF